jgi:dTDP-4-amino-4,6-dideoxygalactose transaminase
MTGADQRRWRVPLAKPVLPALEDYASLLEGVWATRRLTNDGPLSLRLETDVRELTGASHVVATSSGDLGLVLTLAALRLAPGATAVLPSLTFPSTLNAVLWNGLVPRFADVDLATFCLDPDAADSALRGHPGALVLATHAFGGAADVERLEAVAARHGATLVFDGAHALGTFSNGRHVAAAGRATVVSLSPTKPATAAEGGLVITGDEQLDEQLRLLRAYGRGSDGTVHAVGLNAKLSELHAALGVLTLPELERGVAARERLVERYSAALGGVARLQALRAGERPSRTYLAVDLGPGRDVVEARLAAAGVETGRVLQPLHAMAPYRGLAREELQVTEHLGRALTCLPLFAELSEQDVDEIASTVRDALGAAAA